MKEYKKSYKGFILFLISFIVGIFLISILPIASVKIMTIITLEYMHLAMNFLMGMMYYNEQVYWINGTSYEDACKATSKQRKIFIQRHWVKFAKWAAISIIYSIISILVGLPYYIDIIVITLALCIGAISTFNIYLEVD